MTRPYQQCGKCKAYCNVLSLGNICQECMWEQVEQEEYLALPNLTHADRKVFHNRFALAMVVVFANTILLGYHFPPFVGYIYYIVAVFFAYLYAYAKQLQAQERRLQRKI